MHIQCTKEDLLNAVILVEKAVATQNTIPVLTGIQLTAKNDVLTLTSTNLELSIQTHISTHVTTAGQTVIDGRLFSSIIRKLPNEPIIIEFTNKLVITAGTVEFSLNTLADDEFPDFPIPVDEMFSIPAHKILHMIKNTLYACGKDDKRPYINGVLMELTNNNLKLITTDINRLSYYATTLTDTFEDNYKLLVPAKTITELQKSLPHDESEVKVFYFNKQVLFAFGNTILATRLIESEFPNYQHLFPKNQPMQFISKRQILLSAVDRASLLDSDGTQIVIFSITDGVLEIKTPTTEIGQIIEQINVEHTGENGQVAFSARYILDMLKASDADQISLEFNQELRPSLLKPLNNQEHQYILMPIRLS